MPVRRSNKWPEVRQGRIERGKEEAMREAGPQGEFSCLIPPAASASPPLSSSPLSPLPSFLLLPRILVRRPALAHLQPVEEAEEAVVRLWMLAGDGLSHEKGAQGPEARLLLELSCKADPLLDPVAMPTGKGSASGGVVCVGPKGGRTRTEEGEMRESS